MAELRQFRQYIAVAEELSFRRAAERLHMAQPPLTTAIKRLEEEIGATLIERSNRVTRLTEAGCLFLDEARRAVEQAERAMRVAQRAGAGLTGLLRVTFAPSAAREVLSPILRAFRQNYPDVQIELTEAMTAQQLEALHTNRADIGFVVPPLHDAPQITCIAICRNQMVAVLPKDHPLARAKSLTLSDLASEPWILFPERHAPGLHRRIYAACAEAGFTPKIGQEALQMETIVGLVAGGMGVALVSAAIRTSRRKGVAFRNLSGAGTPVDYELALAYGRSSPVLTAFISIATSRDDWNES